MVDEAGIAADLRAGVAVFNAGYHHAAHDAWEARWLDLESGTADERFLHGLIQYTAAVYHARRGNWPGAQGLGESGSEYLADLPADYRGVNVGAVRSYLGAVAADPEHVERVAPPALTHEGRALALADLDPAAAFVAAGVVAEAVDGVEEDVVERAVEYAAADLEAGEDGSRFVALLLDFVSEHEGRAVVYRRLADHVARRQSRDESVAGLFDAADADEE